MTSGRNSVTRRYGAALAGLLAVGAVTLSACGNSHNSGSGTPAAKAPGNNAADNATTKGADPNGVATSSGTITGSKFAKEPCDVLSATEVGQALGTTVTAKPATAATGLKQCNWTSPGNTSGFPDMTLHYNSADLAGLFAAALKHNMLTDKEKKLDLGAGGVLEKGKGDVYVLMGDASEFELYGPLSKPVSDDVMTKLATLAASRLK